MMGEAECTAGAARRLFDGWVARGHLEKMLPEVAALRGVLQPVRYHREGDALRHTLLALKQVRDEDDERVFWAVLLHDIGKARTTRFEDGRWRSPGHAEAGADMAKFVLRRIGRSDLAEDVAWLVRHHQFPLSWGESVRFGLSKRQCRFCRQELFPVLVQVVRADAVATVGASRKGELLNRIVQLAAEKERCAKGLGHECG
jgi:putative nucleotidyltransferase with HDIG domain